MLKDKIYEHALRNGRPTFNMANKVGKEHRKSPISFRRFCEDLRRQFVNPDYASIVERRW